jgi:hypothetical protein
MNNALRNSIARPSLRAAVNSQDLVIDSGAATSLRPVQPGQCLDMVAASSQYIDSGVTVTGGTAVDISFTINPDSVTGGIFKSGGWLAGNKGLTLSMASGAVLVSSSDGTTLGSVGFTGLTLVTGAWYEGRLVWDGATSAPTLTIITGGVSTDYVASGTIAGWVGESAQNLRFGDTAFSYFDGKLGFCKYDSVLQYNNDFSTGTVAIDSSGNNNDGTLVNGPSWTTDNSLPYSWLNQVGFNQYDILARDKTPSSWGESGGVGSVASSSDFALCNRVTQTNLDRFVGVDSSPSPSNLHTDLDYAFYFTGSGAVQIWEAGSSKGAYGGTRVLGDNYEIRRVGTTIIYYKNDALLYTSLTASSATLTPNAVLFTDNSESGLCSLDGVPVVWSSVLAVDNNPAYIPRDEATPANDAFGNALQWSGSAFPRRPVYRGSYAGVFDGTDDYVDITGFTSTEGDYIFKFWIKGAATGGSMNLFDTQTTRMAIGTYGASAFGVYNNGSWKSLGAESLVLDNTWHYVEITCDSGAGLSTMTVDGVASGTTAAYVSSNIGAAVALMAKYDGSGFWVAASVSDFEIATLADSTLIRIPLSEGVGTTVHDISGNGNDGTITNASTATEGAGFWAGRIDGEANAHNINNGFSRRALFDGATTYVSLGSDPFLSLSDFHVSLDYVLYENPAGSSFGTIGSWTSNTEMSVLIFSSSGSSTILARILTTNGLSSDVESTTTLVIGEQMTISLNYDGAELKLLINGVEEDSVAHTGNIVASSGAALPEIGRYNGASVTLSKSTISNISIYNAAQSTLLNQWDGYSPTDWDDKAGSVDGSPNGSFALLRVPADSAAPTLDVYGSTLTNPAVANSHNDAETTWDFENIGTGDTIAPETDHFANFDAVTFSDTNYSLGTTSPINSVFWRDKSGVLKDRGIAFGATLTGVGLVYANNYTDG